MSTLAMQSTRTCATRRPTNSTPYTHGRRLSSQEGGGRPDIRHPTPGGRRDRAEGGMLPVQSLHHFQTNRRVIARLPVLPARVYYTRLFPSLRPALCCLQYCRKCWAQPGNKAAHITQLIMDMMARHFPKG